MEAEERFMRELAEGIRFAGGTAKFSEESALTLARELWRDMKESGVGSYPAMEQQAELRVVYQWDEDPPLVTIMVWDEVMWRDMVRLVVPAELSE